MPFNDDVVEGLVQHNISLLRYDANLRRQIRGQLRVLQEALMERLGSMDFSKPTRRARMEALIKQADDIIRGNFRKLNSIMLAEMAELAGLEHNFAAQQLNRLIGVDIVSAGLTPSALRAMAKEVPIFGAPAQEWWGRQSAGVRRRFADQIRQGYLLGESTQDLVRRIRGSATGTFERVEMAGGKIRSVPVFSGGIMETTTREATTLVRTSVNSVANHVRLETYMRNQDVIKALVAVVTLDGRTSDICMARGARPDEWLLPDMAPVEGSSSWPGHPPWHFNCRSSLAPVTKSWQELQQQGTAGSPTRNQRRIARVLDNNAPKRMRASMNGQVPRSMGFEAWLKKQPARVQLDLLGPTKRKLWKQGKLTLGQLIDQSGRPLTIADLKRIYG